MKRLLSILFLFASLFIYLTSCTIGKNSPVANKEYTINLDANGGEVSPTSIKATLSSDFTLPVPSRTGYSFLGWFYNGEQFSDNGVFNIENDINLKAEWSANKYKVILKNGDEARELEIEYDSSFSLPFVEKEGYTFDGWYLDNTKIEEGKWNIDRDVELIAKFTPNKYIISFDLENVSPQEVLYGTDFILPIIYKDGYTFEGWYLENEKIDNGKWQLAENVELKAHFTPNTYTLTLDVNGGDNLENNKQEVIYDDAFTLTEPTRAGYVFDGWYLDNEKVVSSKWTVASDATLVAHWSLASFKITLNENGANSLTEKEINVKYTKNFTLPTPGRHGYKFDGWYLGNDKVTDGAYNYTSDITLEAKWTANVYNLAFNVNGGDSIGKTSEEVTYGTNVTLPTPTRTGFTFNGWFEGETKIESGVWDIAKNVSVEAKWTANVYKIIYDVNGGVDLENNIQYVTYGQKYTLQTTTRQGYTFRGWYYGETRLEAGTWNKTEDVTVKATWQRKNSGGGGGGSSTVTTKYTVTFNTDGGNQIASQTVNSGTTITLPVPTKENYTFAGWYNGETKIEGTTYKVTSNVTLKAKWGAPFIVTLDVNGGDPLESTTINVVSNTTFTLPIPTKENYIFDGWFNGCERVDSGIYIYQSNLTLVAHFYKASDYEYQVNGDTVEITKFKGTDTVVYIPSKIEDKNVISIGGNAFINCTNITTVILPNTIKKINASAFENCSSLVNLTISSSVLSIGAGAFYGCSSLTSLVLPNGVSSIGSNAFSNCTSLETITLPESITTIGQYAFSKCTSLTTINFSDTLTTIDLGAFSYCTSLASVTFPESLTTINSEAFSNTGLTSLIIPSSVISIGDKAFANTPNLASIIVDVNNEKYDSRDNSNAIISKDSNSLLAGCKNTVIPNTVITIASGAFNGCAGLVDLEIPSSVTSIGTDAFRYCTGLKSLLLPSSVATIGLEAFSYCDSFDTIYYTGNESQFNKLSHIPNKVTVYYLSDTEPNATGNYWHYVNNVVTTWPTKYQVVFNTNGGGDFDSQLVTSGTVINLPVPEKTNYMLTSWYNGEEKITGNTFEVTSNVTLEARWIGNPYTITLDVNDGDALQSNLVNVNYNSSFNLPVPTKDNYTFDGWFYGDEKVTSGTYTYNSNITLVARWTGNPYTITLDVNGGDQLQSNTVNVNYNSSFNLPVPTKDGYTFFGWYYGDEEVTSGTYTYNSNISLVARFYKESDYEYQVIVIGNYFTALTGITTDEYNNLNTLADFNEIPVIFNDLGPTELEEIEGFKTGLDALNESYKQIEEVVRATNALQRVINSAANKLVSQAEIIDLTESLFNNVKDQYTTNVVTANLDPSTAKSYYESASFQALLATAKRNYDSMTDGQKALYDNGYTTTAGIAEFNFAKKETAYIETAINLANEIIALRDKVTESNKDKIVTYNSYHSVNGGALKKYNDLSDAGKALINTRIKHKLDLLKVVVDLLSMKATTVDETTAEINAAKVMIATLNGGEYPTNTYVQVIHGTTEPAFVANGLYFKKVNEEYVVVGYGLSNETEWANDLYYKINKWAGENVIDDVAYIAQSFKDVKNDDSSITWGIDAHFNALLAQAALIDQNAERNALMARTVILANAIKETAPGLPSPKDAKNYGLGNSQSTYDDLMKYNSILSYTGIVDELIRTYYTLGLINQNLKMNDLSESNLARIVEVAKAITGYYELMDQTATVLDANTTYYTRGIADANGVYPYIEVENPDIANKATYYVLVADIGNFSGKNEDGILEDLFALPEALDRHAALLVEDMIDALPAIKNVQISDEANVKAAKEAYNNLTAYQKALVSNYSDIGALEAQIAQLKINAAIDPVADLIADLPAANKVKLTDEDAIRAARNAYDVLTDDEKAAFNTIYSTELSKLVACEDALDTLINSTGLLFELEEGGNSYKVVGFEASDSTYVVIPSTYNDKPVTSIGNNAFVGCSNLTSIIIPNSVTRIGEGTFDNCDSVTSIYYTGTKEEYDLLSNTPTNGTVYYEYGKDYIITLEPNGGIVSSNTINVKKYFDFNLPTPTKERYVFGGWYYGDEEVTSGIYTYNRNISLTAHFYNESDYEYQVIVIRNYFTALTGITTDEYNNLNTLADFNEIPVIFNDLGPTELEEIEGFKTGLDALNESYKQIEEVVRATNALQRVINSAANKLVSQAEIIDLTESLFNNVKDQYTTNVVTANLDPSTAKSYYESASFQALLAIAKRNYASMTDGQKALYENGYTTTAGITEFNFAKKETAYIETAINLANEIIDLSDKVSESNKDKIVTYNSNHSINGGAQKKYSDLSDAGKALINTRIKHKLDLLKVVVDLLSMKATTVDETTAEINAAKVMIATLNGGEYPTNTYVQVIHGTTEPAFVANGLYFKKVNEEYVVVGYGLSNETEWANDLYYKINKWAGENVNDDVAYIAQSFKDVKNDDRTYTWGIEAHFNALLVQAALNDQNADRNALMARTVILANAIKETAPGLPSPKDVKREGLGDLRAAYDGLMKYNSDMTKTGKVDELLRLYKTLGLITSNLRMNDLSDSNLEKIVEVSSAITGMYKLTEDVSIDENKTYYTKGDTDVNGVTAYIEVANPAVADIANYYEKEAEIGNFSGKNEDGILEDLFALPEALDKYAAGIVEDMIDALPAIKNVQISDEANVKAAKEAYNNLTAAQKLLVTNYNDIAALEAQIAQLKINAKIDPVADLIDDLPAASKVKLTDEAAIRAARDAYDALIDDEKAAFNTIYSTELSKLVACEDALDALINSIGLSFELEDGGNSYKVSGIGTCADTDVIIPSSYNGKPVTSIGDEAFRGLSNLTSVTIPNSVTTIGAAAFYECSGLTNVIIPNSVTSIGGQAFYCNGNLTSIIVEEGNNVYDSRDNCNAIIETSTNKLLFGSQNTVIPNSVTWIGNYAFQGCINLTSITIPNSITSIGNWAFAYTGLTSITIPNSVTNIGILAFSYCSNLTSIVVEEGNNIYDSRNNCNAIVETSTNTLIAGCQNTVIPYSVTSIGDNAFSGCSNLTNIVIPNSVTSIGVQAFYECYNLISITIPNGVTSIKNGTFYYCSSLTSVIMPNNVTTIGSQVFSNCTNLTSVTIPNSVTSIGSYAFSYCSSLTSVTIPNSVTSIGVGAFENCTSLTSIMIPNSLKSISGFAFSKCSSLTNISIPNSVLSIGYYAFDGCINLTSIIIPNSVTNIESSAFYNCSSLTSIILSNSVTSIGFDAFYKCNNLTSIYYTGTKEEYDLLSNTPSNGTVYYEYGKDYVITLDPNGGIVSSNTVNVKRYFDFTLPTPTKEGYTFDGWFNGQEKVASGTYTYNSNITLEARWTANPYTITLDVNGGDQLQNNTINVTYNGTFTLPTSTKEGYMFDGWFYGDEKVTSRTYTYNSNISLIAHFYKENDYEYQVINSNEIEITKYKGTDSVVYVPSLLDSKPVTSIGNYAFSNCYNLSSITIPNSVRSIGEGAFSDTGLTIFTIPNSVTIIGIYALARCSSLTSITIPNSVTSIVSSVLTGCINLTSIVVEETNTTYDSRENCNAIIETSTNKLIVGCQKTIIPNSITVIGENAFSGCTNLTSIMIPNSVKNIRDNAFSGCSNLTSIKIPNSVTSIGYGAFAECSNLTSITIPNSVTTIGNYVFSSCGKLTSIVVEEGNSLYDSRENCNAIIKTSTNSLVVGCQDTVIPNSITSIGLGAFYGHSRLANIIIPDSVTSIGDFAFYGCSNLTSVTIPDSVTSIGLGAFESCTSFTSVIIPNSLTSIGRQAFRGCSNLTSVTIPNSVTSIENSAFANCTNLTSIIIPNSITNIGNKSFNNCNNLTSIYYTGTKEEYDLLSNTPSNGTVYYEYGKDYVITLDSNGGTVSSNTINVKRYFDFTLPTPTKEGYTFGGWYNGQEKVVSGTYTYNSNITLVANWASSGLAFELEEGGNSYKVSGIGTCTDTDVIIPSIYNGKLVTSIGNRAFYNCNNITSITIPNSVTSIGDSAFFYCNNLTSVTIPNSVTRIGGYAFSNSTNLANITIPNSVTNIGSSTFEGCINLTSITISNSVTSIGDYTFSGCRNLTSITIPNSVTSIGRYVFQNCTSLTSVTISNSVTSIENNTFYLCDNLTSIIVEEGNSVYDSRNNCNAIIETSTNTLIKGCQNTVIPNSVTSIGNEAFRTCSSLTSITIPNSVTRINYYAFFGCSSLTSIIIPNSVTNIDGSAFAFCSNLTSVVVEEGNSVYDSRNNCNAIIETSTNTLIAGCQNTVIPNSITSIGDYAFAGCSNLTNVTIPNGVTSIGKQAFWYCENLTNITIPNSVIIIGNSTFSICSRLTSITIPNSVTSIGESAFFACGNLTSIYYTGTEEEYSLLSNTPTNGTVYYEYGKDFVITLNPNGGTVSSNTVNVKRYFDFTLPTPTKEGYTFDGWYKEEVLVESGTYTYNSNITLVARWTANPYTITLDVNGGDQLQSNTINVTYNGTFTLPTPTKAGYAFSGWYKEEILVVSGTYTYSSNITLVARWASSGLAFELEEGGNSYKVIGIGTCTDTDVIIPSIYNGKLVTSIGDYAFEGCSSLTSVTIPNSVTSIGYAAFFGCSNLTSVTIPSSVSIIGTSAFEDCSSLTSITIPNSVTSIGDYAFSGCIGLTSIIVEEGNSVYDSRDNCNAIIETSTNSLIRGCRNTVIPNSVTSIGNEAFRGCSNLTSITIPNSVTSIGDSAFFYCNNLTSVTIPNSVTIIEDNAFYGCSNLTNVTISNSVTSIGGNAFSYCSSLTSITLQNSLTSIGEGAFFGCSSLISVILANSVTSIGDGAFDSCNNLTSIIIPNSVTSIGNNAFYGCDNLTFIYYTGTEEEYDLLENTPTNGTVYYEYGKECVITLDANGGTVSSNTINAKRYFDFTLPTPTKENYTFEGWFNGQEKVVSGTYAYNSNISLIAHFYKESDYEYQVINTNEIEITRYNGSDSVVYVPSMLDGKPVTSLAVNSFANNKSITNVVLPNSIITIGNQAFYKCDNLTSIVLPDSLTTIGRSAFWACTSLSNAIIPNNVISIGGLAFGGCNLTSIVIPSSVESIDASAFAMSNLASIVVEEGNSVYDSRNNCNAIIETSTNKLIAGCYNTVIPNTVTSIGSGAFNGCSNLISITIPSSITSIESNAFPACYRLVEVVNKSNLEIVKNSSDNGNVAKYAANVITDENDSGLRTTNDDFIICDAKTNGQIIDVILVNYIGNETSLVIPNDVITIGTYAFGRLTDIISITIPNSVTGIGEYAFSNCTNLTSIAIPNSVTSIGSSAFNYCTSLTSITIPNSVTNIGSSAFYNCSSLTSIIIANSVTSIGSSAFNYCNNLNTIYFIGTSEEYSNLTNMPGNVNVYYYSESTPVTAGNYWHYVNSEPVIWE